MARTRYVYVIIDGEIQSVPLGSDASMQYPDAFTGEIRGEARLSPSHHIITDEMPAVQSHADGLWYTSKKAYEAGVKAAGCVIVGDEKIKAKGFDRKAQERRIEEVLHKSWEQAGGWYK